MCDIKIVVFDSKLNETSRRRFLIKKKVKVTERNLIFYGLSYLRRFYIV